MPCQARPRHATIPREISPKLRLGKTPENTFQFPESWLTFVVRRAAGHGQ
jgi:hypothetical protein